MSGALTKVVVLAAGRGTRMRESSTAVLTDEQRAAADRGLKPLIPFGGQPFIAYVLSSLADAGFTDVCIVTGPGDDPVRAAAEGLHAKRLRLHFAVQESPRGSAHAVLAASAFVGSSNFVVINADNDYPADAFAALRDLDGPGLIGFSADGLLEAGIPADRIAAYALLETDATSDLIRIVEKPSPEELANASRAASISMTCWRFAPSILDACRAVPLSARGELELPDAVRLTLEQGVRYRVVPMHAGVVDLSRRDDIPAVERALRNRTAAP